MITELDKTGVKVSIPARHNDRHVPGLELPRMPFDVILDIIGAMCGLDWQINGDHVVFQEVPS